MYAFAGAEALVGHRIARQHALGVVDHVVDDRS